MPTWLLADLLVALHCAYVSFVVLVVPMVLFGAWRRWSWVRNSWLRNIHLAMILIVVFEAVLGIPCPLTVWEQELRVQAGQTGYSGSFLGHSIHELLFFEFEESVFTVVYAVYGALVVALYLFAPPRCLDRRPRRQATPSASR
jgi:hypothetical protein